MRFKRALATGTLLAATATGALLATTSAAEASAVKPNNGWVCQGYGTGATPQAAHLDAMSNMIGDITVGGWVYTNGEYSDGTYWQLISADCVGVR